MPATHGWWSWSTSSPINIITLCSSWAWSVPPPPSFVESAAGPSEETGEEADVAATEVGMGAFKVALQI